MRIDWIYVLNMVSKEDSRSTFDQNNFQLSVVHYVQSTYAN